MAVTAASPPLFPTFPPARSIACGKYYVVLSMLNIYTASLSVNCRYANSLSEGPSE